MPNRWGRIPFFAVALCCAGPACAQGTDFRQGATYQKVVEHGKQITLGYYYDVNPDCTSGGDFSIYTTSRPQGGQVSFVQTRDFPTFPSSNIRSKCNGRRVDVTKVLYRARRDFTGLDAFGLQSVTPNGNAIDSNLQVTVR